MVLCIINGVGVVVYARLPEELKKKADLYGIKIGKLLRDALEKEIRNIENQKLSGQLDKLRDEVGNRVTKKDVVDAVRSSRD